MQLQLDMTVGWQMVIRLQRDVLSWCGSLCSSRGISFAVSTWPWSADIRRTPSCLQLRAAQALQLPVIVTEQYPKVRAHC